jgi:hypothetical protein
LEAISLDDMGRVNSTTGRATSLRFVSATP